MVSVIIPVYNGEQYIKRCLDSIFATGSEVGDIEVIVINDGSKDSSLQILNDYAREQDKLRVIDQENTGAARARQKGIRAAKGDFIAFLDIDDWVEPNMYEKLEQKALQSEADIVFCDYAEEYASSQNVVKNQFSREQTFPLTGKDALLYLHQRQAIFPYPWNKIYRTELIRTVEFPEGTFVGEDYNMLLQLFEQTDRIDYLDLVGYHYAIVENSVSRRGFTDITVRSYVHFKEDYDMMCAKHPDMKREVVNYLIIEYMAMIIAMGRNKTFDKAMIKEIKSFVRKGFWGFFSADYVSLKMKGSALALLISYRLLIGMYRLISK